MMLVLIGASWCFVIAPFK
ncbi:hypothetical protein ACO0LD_30810 [Undibacterium sp. Ji83W]